MRMNRILLLAALAATLALALPNEAAAQKKQALHTAYVMKNMRLDAATKAKFEPVLDAYYKEMAAAKADYKKLKDKYDDMRDAGKLTDTQCDQLFNGKLAQEKAELAVREKYYAKFKTVLSTAQAYQAIRLCNDKVE